MVYDTIHKVILETLWREPDSVGKIYPIKTIRTESAAQRQTQNDIVTQLHDTIYVESNKQTNIKEDNQISAPSTTSQLLPWLIILGMIIISIAIIALR